MPVRTTPSPRTLRIALLAVVLLAFAGGRAVGQPSPLWDHYKAYQVQPPLTHPTVVSLLDQFMQSTHQVDVLEWFANPVMKEHAGVKFPINRPELHYTWWRITQQPFTMDVIARNQFGDQPLRLGMSRYLLNPANKNAPAGVPLPLANHYKCYDCTGPVISVPLVLTDQFYTRNAVNLIPVFFCTPVEKRTQEGGIYPMTDPRQHYTVYDIGPETPIWPATIADQFIPVTPVQLTSDRLLMVPTDKSFPPTSTKPSTWGRLKQLYR